MFYEDMRIKQGLSYISFYPLRVLYNSKFILKAISLLTNAAVVMRVHCKYNMSFTSSHDVYTFDSRNTNNLSCNHVIVLESFVL